MTAVPQAWMTEMPRWFVVLQVLKAVAQEQLESMWRLGFVWGLQWVWCFSIVEPLV